MTNKHTYRQGPFGEAAHIHQQGMALWRAGQLDEALGHFLKALEMKEKVGDTSNASSSLHMVGVVFARKRDWVNAGRYFLRSLRIDAEDRDSNGVAKSLNDLAVMCGERGRQHDKAVLLDLGNRILRFAARRQLISAEECGALCHSLHDKELGQALAVAVAPLFSGMLSIEGMYLTSPLKFADMDPEFPGLVLFLQMGSEGWCFHSWKAALVRSEPPAPSQVDKARGFATPDDASAFFKTTLRASGWTS